MVVVVAMGVRVPEPLDDKDAHGFVLMETSFHVYNADGQKTSLVGERTVGAAVDVDVAVWCKAMEQPEVAIADRLWIWEEACM